MAATLHKEILEIILARLDLADQARFSSVNKWWRSVAAENLAVNQPLSLVGSHHPEILISKLLHFFFGTSCQEARFLGNCEDWLACMIVCPRQRFFLLNIAWLPDYPAISSNLPSKIILSSPPSSPDKCIIVLMDNCYSLAFCRLGDTLWTKFLEKQSLLRDIIFIKDQLYCIDLLGTLRVFDSGLNSNPTVSSFPPFRSSYLANSASDDKLLVISRIPGLRVMRAKKFKVFEFDPMNLSYIEVKSLGDNILFVSSCSSFTLSAKDHPEFRPNHLYEVPYEMFEGPEDEKFSDFSLNDKTLERGGNNGNKCLVFFTLFRRPCFIKQTLPWVLNGFHG